MADAARCPTVGQVSDRADVRPADAAPVAGARAARAALLRRRVLGVAPVGGGLFLLGVSAYVVLGIAGHSLSPGDYAAVASLYLLAAITGPGIFLALEQETNRETSSRLATGIGTQPVPRGAGLVAAGLAAVVVVALLALSPVLVPRALGGSWTLLAAAVVAVAGSAAVYLLRGVFAGERRWAWYATSLAGEGGVRIVLCVALGLLGVALPGAFGFAFALGTGVAALLCLPGLRRGEPGPPVDIRRMSSGTIALAFASGLTYVVANCAPLVLTSRLTDAPELAASFVSLFVLSRIPVFLFHPLQAFLLPSLAAGVERADLAHVRSRLLLALGAVAVVGLPCAALTAAFGPWAARTFFNAPLDLSHLAAGLLGLSTVAMMLAQALQPALVALGVHRVATAAWLAGIAVFALLLFGPDDVVVGAIAAQVAAPVVVSAVMGVAIVGALRRMPAGIR